MAIILNSQAITHARSLINAGSVDQSQTSWSEEKPSPQDEDNFLMQHTWSEYGLWFLAINTDKAAHDKARYEFPYGNFKTVSKKGLIAVEQRAAQFKHDAVAAVARELLALIDTNAAR